MRFSLGVLSVCRRSILSEADRAEKRASRGSSPATFARVRLRGSQRFALVRRPRQRQNETGLPVDIQLPVGQKGFELQDELGSLPGQIAPLGWIVYKIEQEVVPPSSSSFHRRDRTAFCCRSGLTIRQKSCRSTTLDSPARIGRAAVVVREYDERVLRKVVAVECLQYRADAMVGRSSIRT
jgi:hypothetical protein